MFVRSVAEGTSAPKRSKAERMKNPKVMRIESLLVYAVGSKVRRHRSQYLVCRSMLSFGSPISIELSA